MDGNPPPQDSSKTVPNLISNSVPVDPATNRITGTGYGYDFNGNMTQDGLNTLTYDAENRVVRPNSSEPTYVYDGAGLRCGQFWPQQGRL